MVRKFDGLERSTIAKYLTADGSIFKGASFASIPSIPLLTEEILVFGSGQIRRILKATELLGKFQGIVGVSEQGNQLARRLTSPLWPPWEVRPIDVPCFCSAENNAPMTEPPIPKNIRSVLLVGAFLPHNTNALLDAALAMLYRDIHVIGVVVLVDDTHGERTSLLHAWTRVPVFTGDELREYIETHPNYLPLPRRITG